MPILVMLVGTLRVTDFWGATANSADFTVLQQQAALQTLPVIYRRAVYQRTYTLWMREWPESAISK